MSGRLIYFTLNESPISYNTKLKKIGNENHYNPKPPTYEGYVLLECLDSVLMDGTLTRLSIDGGKSYLEVRSDK